MSPRKRKTIETKEIYRAPDNHPAAIDFLSLFFQKREMVEYCRKILIKGQFRNSFTISRTLAAENHCHINSIST